MELMIEGLTKTYPNGVRALEDVSLRIGRGMYGLLGPNGAGKTTLMHTVATLQTADRGHVRFDDIDAATAPRAMRRRLGYLPQDFGVYPNTTAWEMLEYLARLKGLGDRRHRHDHLNELLDLVNLAHVARRSLDTFSGGMRQRFGVAQALIGWPDLLIVDEPTAGLDPAERHRFHELIASTGEQRVVILSTHIVEDVTNLCQRLAILHAGRVVAEGTPDTLIAAWRGRLWERAIARTDASSYRSRYSVIGSQLQGGALRLIVEANTAPDGFELRDPTLEDVYFASVRSAAMS
jgi:ABC-type multidrug transport system ATPase subunit